MCHQFRANHNDSIILGMSHERNSDEVVAEVRVHQIDGLQGALISSRLAVPH